MPALTFELGCGLVGGGGATAEEGVVGCVDSASDGACEVIGVAGTDGSRAGTVVSGTSGTSGTSCASGVDEGFP